MGEKNPPGLLMLKQLDGRFAQSETSAQSALSAEIQLAISVVPSLCKHFACFEK